MNHPIDYKIAVSIPNRFQSLEFTIPGYSELDAAATFLGQRPVYGSLITEAWSESDSEVMITDAFATLRVRPAR